MRNWVVLDFETASAVDLSEAGAWRYAEDPTTEVICAGFSYNGAEPKLWVPGDPPATYWLPLLNLARDPEIIFIAFNAAFEKAIWRHIMVPIFDMPDIPNERWHDIMAVCAQKVLPQKLDRVLRVLGIGEKDTAGSAAAKALSKPVRATKKTRADGTAGSLDRSPATLQRVYDYCISDVMEEVALHRRVGWLQHTAQWSEREVWLEDQQQNEEGLCLDLDYVQAGQTIIDQAIKPLAEEFRQLTGGLEPTQVAKLRAWCQENGARLPSLDKETVKKALGFDIDDDGEGSDDLDWDDWQTYIDLTPAVRRALTIRQLVGSASVKKLARMLACVSADGQSRGLFVYHGTGPGRRSARLWQPQNMPRGTIQIGKGEDAHAPPPQAMVDVISTRDAGLVEALLGPPVEVVLSGLRHAIVAKPGHVLAAGDLAGIQARVVLALAGQWDKVDLLASGADVYLDMATAIYKPEVPFTKKANVEERQTGKNSVLGLGFGMGAKKFRFKYCAAQPEEFAQRVVDTYRQEWAPEVPRLWREIERAALAAVRHPGRAVDVGPFTYCIEDIWLVCRCPSGGKLWYAFPELTRRAMPWDPLDVREGWKYKATKQGQLQDVHAFGGLLTENVVMKVERDLIVCAAKRLRAAGYPPIMDSHDEIVTQPLLSRNPTKHEMEQIMSEVPKWAEPLRIPIATDAWINDRYKK